MVLLGQQETIRRSNKAEVDRKKKEGPLSLRDFVQQAWPILEPGKTYSHNWHIDAICAHLEAVTRGEVHRLLINIPPAFAKSLLVSVLWPAWEWGPAGKPWLRYLSTSYAEDYATRDARKMRDLVLSDWYQANWGATVTLTRAGETSFENTSRGGREAMAFRSLTGGRGDRVIIDDPHSVTTAEYEAQRDETLRVFRESVPSRVNDSQRSAIVIICQRLNAKDVSAEAIEQGYLHVMYPMEFELERRSSTPYFTDPRTVDGELLDPGRFPRSSVDRDKKAMQTVAVASQYQQRPTAREGGLFKKAWFAGKIMKLSDLPTSFFKIVRHWDLAATEAKIGTDPDYTCGVKLAHAYDGRFIVWNVKRGRWAPHDVSRTIKATAELDGLLVEVSLPQDPGQAGKSQVSNFVSLLAGFTARARIESGSKETRATPISVQAEAGNVYLLEGPWNDDFIDELVVFPGGAHDDQVDALSGAFARLTDTPAAAIVVPVVVSQGRDGLEGTPH